MKDNNTMNVGISSLTCNQAVPILSDVIWSLFHQTSSAMLMRIETMVSQGKMGGKKSVKIFRTARLFLPMLKTKYKVRRLLSGELSHNRIYKGGEKSYDDNDKLQ